MLATTPVLRRVHEIAPLDGRNLRELMVRGERPDRARLIGWGIQLLEIVAEAHSEGLVYGGLREEDVILIPDGCLVLLLGPFPSGEPFTVQNDLYEVGCLLRRLAFAAGVHRSRGGRGLGARDPLFKVLARAAFPAPAARYQSAGEMAEALREAGQTAMAPGPRRLEERAAPSRVAEFPGIPRVTAPGRPAKKKEDGDLWYAMVLLVISLLLMTFTLATGWYILDRDRSAMPVSGPAVLHPSPPGPQAALSH
jgi:hypothetical protein